MAACSSIWCSAENEAYLPYRMTPAVQLQNHPDVGEHCIIFHSAWGGGRGRGGEGRGGWGWRGGRGGGGCLCLSAGCSDGREHYREETSSFLGFGRWWHHFLHINIYFCFLSLKVKKSSRIVFHPSFKTNCTETQLISVKYSYLDQYIIDFKIKILFKNK